LQDGRTLVTDGALALDAALAKPPVPPSDLGPSPGGILERHLSADLPDEFRLAQLEPGQRPQTYVAPSGVVLSARYVDYLRRTLPERNLRLRMKGELDPVVLVLDGRPVGLLMPMRP
jgi:hypothetical protein